MALFIRISLFQVIVDFAVRLYHVAPGGQEESTKLQPNEDIVSQLAIMGFSHLHCQKAAINTSNAGVEEAMNWLLSHMEDPGFVFITFTFFFY